MDSGPDDWFGAVAATYEADIRQMAYRPCRDSGGRRFVECYPCDVDRWSNGARVETGRLCRGFGRDHGCRTQIWRFPVCRQLKSNARSQTGSDLILRLTALTGSIFNVTGRLPLHRFR